jgi:hypothetical protein
MSDGFDYVSMGLTEEEDDGRLKSKKKKENQTFSAPSFSLSFLFHLAGERKTAGWEILRGGSAIRSHLPLSQSPTHFNQQQKHVRAASGKT